MSFKTGTHRTLIQPILMALWEITARLMTRSFPILMIVLVTAAWAPGFQAKTCSQKDSEAAEAIVDHLDA